MLAAIVWTGRVDSGPPLTFALAVINICAMIPVAALVIGLHLLTPKAGKGIAIYGAIALALLIVYLVFRG
jgi:hypothetical protein